MASKNALSEADRLVLDNYESTLLNGLMKLCKTAGILGDTLLSSPDIDAKWEEFIQEYIEDAVREFNDFPEAAIAWPAFMGMAVAKRWDEDWEKYKGLKYKDLYGPNGWDDMDEGILHYVLGVDLSSDEASRLAGTMKSCALAALGLIRHEGIEAQTALGFFALSRTYTVMYRIGEAVGLYRLKYSMTPLPKGPVS